MIPKEYLVRYYLVETKPLYKIYVDDILISSSDSYASRGYEYKIMGLIKLFPPPLAYLTDSEVKTARIDRDRWRAYIDLDAPTRVIIPNAGSPPKFYEETELVKISKSYTLKIPSQTIDFFHEKCLEGTYKIKNVVGKVSKSFDIKVSCRPVIEPGTMSLYAKIKVPYFYTNYPTYVAYSIQGLQYLVPIDCRGRDITYPSGKSPREIVIDTALKAGNIFNDSVSYKYDCSPYIVVYWNGAFIKKDYVRQGDYVEFSDNIRIYPMDGRSTLTVSLLHVKFEPPTTWLGSEGCMAYYPSGDHPLLSCFLFKKFRITFEYGEIRTIDTYPNYYRRGYVDPDVLNYSPKELIKVYRVSTGVYDFEVSPRIGFRNRFDIPSTDFKISLEGLQWRERIDKDEIYIDYDVLRCDNTDIDNVLRDVKIYLDRSEINRSGRIKLLI
jgi:hypothetical protein